MLTFVRFRLQSINKGEPKENNPYLGKIHTDN